VLNYIKRDKKRVLRMDYLKDYNTCKYLYKFDGFLSAQVKMALFAILFAC